MARKHLVVGNWKMYIESPEDAHTYALTLRRRVRGLTGVEVWLAPPYPLLPDVAHVLDSSSVHVGAQAVSAHDEPAHTGEVSAKTLKKVGALFALVGHSERRMLGETHEMVRGALAHAVAAGLAPVLCIGEREREADGEHFNFLEQQLVKALEGAPPQVVKKLVVAYEPVWAIGRHASDAMQPSEIEEVVIFIRKTLADLFDRRVALKVPILYGGAVEPSNALTIITEGGVNGLLVGHASANVEEFLEIIKATQN